MFRFWRGKWYMAPWPKKRGPAKSVYQQRAQDDFGLASKLTKYTTPQEYGAASGFVTGSMYVPRDIIVRAMFGLLSRLTLEDGSVIRGVREVVGEANLLLDQVTTVPWSMVIRLPDPIGWSSLTPGDPGQVIGVKPDGTVDFIDATGNVSTVFGRAGNVVATDGDYTALQVSYDPTASGLSAVTVQDGLDELAADIDAVVAAFPASLQAALDAIDNTPGALLYRDTSGWIALPPGAGGYALIAQTSSPYLSWQNIVVGGGSVPFLPPIAANFATLRNSPSITDSPTKGMIVTGAAGGTAIRAGYQALGGDAVYTAHITMTGLANNVSAGLAFRDSSGGKCITFGPDFESSALRVQCTQWTNDTSAASNAWSAPQWQYGGMWLKATWHAAAKTIDLDVSPDGVNWLRMQTANAFIAAPNQVGFYMWSTTTGTFGAGNCWGVIDYYTKV